MSRYLLLLLLNSPLIMAGVMNAVVDYKTKKKSRNSYLTQLLLWLSIALGLLLAEPLYNYLRIHQLTDTDSLSLFDVIQITAIIFLLYSCVRSYGRINGLEERLKDLHQETSIQMSTKRK